MRAVSVASLLLALGWGAVSLAKPHSGVALQISVAGAQVTVDGHTRETDGAQAVTLPLAPGEHTVRVEHDGFRAWEQKVTVSAGATEHLDVLLALDAPPPEPPKPVVVAPPPKPPEPVPPPPKVARPIRVGVYEVKANAGVDARMTGVLTDALLDEVRKLDRISAIGMEEIGEMLSFEQKRQMLGCEQDACLAEIAGAMGVDELVTGTVSTLAGSRLFTIRRIDMTHATVKATVTKRLAVGNGEEMLATIGPAIEELYAEYPLRPGRVRGVSKAVAARLNPPPLPKAAFFATAGGALAAAIVGTVFEVKYSQFQGEFSRDAENSQTAPIQAATLKSERSSTVTYAQRTNYAFGVAGGVAIVAGVMAFFTDWHGYASGASSLHASPKVAVSLAPGGVIVSWGP